MVKHALSIAAAALTLMAPAPMALAQDGPLIPPDTVPAVPSGDPVLDDLVCMVAMSEITQDAPEQIQQDTASMVMFFIGKLIGREPGFSFARAVPLYTDRIEAIDLPRQVVRCLNEFEGMTGVLGEAAES